MVVIPANVADMIKRPGNVKVLSTCDANGQPHTIVCGSVFLLDEETLAVGEVLMKTTKKNLEENKKVCFLVTSAADAYIIDAVAKERIGSGPILDGLNEKLYKMNPKVHAVWLFTATGVTVASASHEAGKKVA